MLKHGILGLLNYGDMTGYEIREVFKSSLNYFWTAQTSQIYRELQGLEKKRWVRHTLVEQSGKPDKKVYSITGEGKTELLRWMSEDGTGLDMRTPVLMRVFFFGERSPQENIEYFKRLREECQDYLKAMEPIEDTIDTYGNIINEPQKTLYWQMTANFGRKSMQRYIDWADECIKLLEDRI